MHSGEEVAQPLADLGQRFLVRDPGLPGDS